MTKSKRTNVLAMAIAALSVTPVWAQTGAGHALHHGGAAPAAEVPKKTGGSMPAMDHGGMNHEAMPGMSGSRPE